MNSIQIFVHHTIPLILILILSSHLCLGIPNGLFFVIFFCALCVLRTPAFHPPLLGQFDIVWWAEGQTNLLAVYITSSMWHGCVSRKQVIVPNISSVDRRNNMGQCFRNVFLVDPCWLWIIITDPHANIIPVWKVSKIQNLFLRTDFR